MCFYPAVFRGILGVPVPCSSVYRTPLRKPNRGKGIVFKKPRLKNLYDFLGLFYCFTVQLYGYVVLHTRILEKNITPTPSSHTS